MAIRILTDSVSDIPKELAQAAGIDVLPLSVNFGDHSYLDGIDLSSEAFFEKLMAAEKLPTTSQVSPGTFMEAFEKHIHKGDQVLAILMSSKLSGTYQAACTAVEMLETDQVHVIDSQLVTFATGQIVLELAKLASEGLSMEDLIIEAHDMIKQTHCFFLVDTLECLLKGGRLKPAEALVGNLLNIKPLLTMRDGELKSLSKARGRKKAIKEALKQIELKQLDLNGKHVALYHAVSEDYMKELHEALLEVYPKMEVTFAKVGAVVGTHSGIGCVAIAVLDRPIAR